MHQEPRSLNPSVEMRAGRWYRRHWCPWGKSIGFSETKFIYLGEDTFQLERSFFVGSERVRGYSPRRLLDDDGKRFKFNTFKEALDFLRAYKEDPDIAKAEYKSRSNQTRERFV